MRSLGTFNGELRGRVATASLAWRPVADSLENGGGHALCDGPANQHPRGRCHGGSGGSSNEPTRQHTPTAAGHGRSVSRLRPMFRVAGQSQAVAGSSERTGLFRITITSFTRVTDSRSALDVPLLRSAASTRLRVASPTRSTPASSARVATPAAPTRQVCSRLRHRSWAGLRTG